MLIHLDTIDLTRYNDTKHHKLKEDFENASSSKFIDSIKDRLISSSYNEDFSFQSAYVTEENGVSYGYIYLSSMKDDEISIEISMLKDFRGKGYGSRTLTEVSNYLFDNHNIKTITCDIDPSNKRSINMATTCGFFPDEDEFAERGYTGRMKFVKDNPNYISKRRKF